MVAINYCPLFSALHQASLLLKRSKLFSFKIQPEAAHCVAWRSLAPVRAYKYIKLPIKPREPPPAPVPAKEMRRALVFPFTVSRVYISVRIQMKTQCFLPKRVRFCYVSWKSSPPAQIFKNVLDSGLFAPTFSKCASSWVLSESWATFLS